MQKLQILLTFFFICTLTIISHAQNEDKLLIKQVNLSILYPGVSAELPISKKTSIVPKLGLGFGFGGTVSSNGTSSFNFVVAPAFSFQGRLYYNGLMSSSRKGKELFANSGNYAFLQLAGNLPPIAASSSIVGETVIYNIGAGWGLQRLYGNRFLVSWGIGLGYYSTQTIGLIGEFTLGINLYKA